MPTALQILIAGFHLSFLGFGALFHYQTELRIHAFDISEAVGLVFILSGVAVGLYGVFDRESPAEK